MFLKVATDNNEFLEESDYYTKILNIFLKEGDQQNLKELWKDRSIIELMSDVKKYKNKEHIKNALIVLLSLFDDVPPDLFNSIGTNIETLSKEDREEVIRGLKEIFLENE